MKWNIEIKRNSKNEIVTTFDEFVNGVLLVQEGHRLGYHHLTTWSTLCKMLEPVNVPGDKKQHRMFHLGAAAHMNDISDAKCGKNVYFSSFSFGPPENISMWTNYGIPNPEAIRIRFTSGSFMLWKKKFEKGEIGVFGVSKNGQLERINELPELKFVDVAYWSKREKGWKKDDEDEGLFFYDHDRFKITDRKGLVKRMEKMPYLFKEYGWSYERETRIVLIFNEPMADRYSRIAVEFDGPINNLEKNFNEYVTRGPWYSEEKSPKTLANGHSLSEAKMSRYQDKVKMRSVCDLCAADIKTCKCPFKGQR